MGSDLYMESQSFRPRADKVYWDEFGEILTIERDFFYDGYKVVWQGKPEGKEDVLNAFGVHVPEKPEQHPKHKKFVVEFDLPLGATYDVSADDVREILSDTWNSHIRMSLTVVDG